MVLTFLLRRGSHPLLKRTRIEIEGGSALQGSSIQGGIGTLGRRRRLTFSGGRFRGGTGRNGRDVSGSSSSSSSSSSDKVAIARISSCHFQISRKSGKIGHGGSRHFIATLFTVNTCFGSGNNFCHGTRSDRRHFAPSATGAPAAASVAAKTAWTECPRRRRTGCVMAGGISDRTIVRLVSHRRRRSVPVVAISRNSHQQSASIVKLILTMIVLYGGGSSRWAVKRVM